MNADQMLRLTADVVFRSRIRRSLPVLALFVTERCNGSCLACPIHQLPSPQELTLDQIVRIRKDASRLGTQMVLLSGGEPLLHPDIVAIVDELVNRGGMRVNLSTNGKRLDASLARQLGAVNLTSICVSVESPSPDIHDSLRGQGSHAAALEAVRQVRTHAPRVKVSLGTTITTRSLPTLAEMPALARALGAHSIRAQMVRAGFEQAGLAPDVFDSLKIDAGSAQRLQEQVERLRQQADAHQIRTDSGEYLEDMCRALEGQRCIACVAGELIGCVTARGWIRPCPDVDLALPLEGGLAAAWNSSRFVAFREARARRPCTRCCTDATYHNMSAVLERLRHGRLTSVLQDATYYALHRSARTRS